MSSVVPPSKPASSSFTGRPLAIGDPAPWYVQGSIANAAAHQNTIVGGYRTVLFFFGSTREPHIRSVLQQFLAAQDLFRQQQVTSFAVGIDPADRQWESSADDSRFIWDFQTEISWRYGVCQSQAAGGLSFEPTSFILDENLRVVQVVPVETHIPHVDRLLSLLQALPPPQPVRTYSHLAPVLFVPQVLPPALCHQLIDRYKADGGTASGFMKQEGDKTVVMLDPTIKRRRDWLITEPALLGEINQLIGRRVKPEIEKAFQFRITNFERYVVACYDATDQGFFQRHRDNLSVGTAHRRFAMTINLNAGAYEGGSLRFPEYGTDLYSPDTGGAIVFSCSLLHEATPVTQGRRFALLSFFFNEEDAQRREQNQAQVVREAAAVEQVLKGTASPPPLRTQSGKAPGSKIGFQPKRKK